MLRAVRIILPVGAVVFLCALVGLTCFPVVTIPTTPGWQQSRFQLRDIGMAIHHYHDSFRCLPPPAVYGKDGTPLLSWRVLILPFVSDDLLYKQFKLDEPWDSPHNKLLLEKVPDCYSVTWPPQHPLTHFRAFVGPGTAFEREGLTWKDFPNGLEKTILVVQASEPVPWTKPDELVYDPAKPLPRLGGVFTKPVHFLRFETSRKAGFGAAFADGKARFITNLPDEATLRALITRNGGEKVDLSRLED
jgi:hypothetical protein